MNNEFFNHFRIVERWNSWYKYKGFPSLRSMFSGRNAGILKMPGKCRHSGCLRSRNDCVAMTLTSLHSEDYNVDKTLKIVILIKPCSSHMYTMSRIRSSYIKTSDLISLIFTLWSRTWASCTKYSCFSAIVGQIEPLYVYRSLQNYYNDVKLDFLHIVSVGIFIHWNINEL